MGGNVTVGGNISASAGPIGTGGAVQASLASPAPMFSYSKSKGQSLALLDSFDWHGSPRVFDAGETCNDYLRDVSFSCLLSQ